MMNIVRDSLIGPLLFCGGPPHIARLITAIVINAVKGMKTARPFSNTRSKRSKGILPFLANSYSAKPVVRFPGVSDAGTASNHALPYVVESAFASSVRSVYSAGGLSLKTSAASMLPTSNVSPSSNDNVAAVATTFPRRLIVKKTVPLYYKEAVDFLSRKINKLHVRTLALSDINSTGTSHG